MRGIEKKRGGERVGYKGAAVRRGRSQDSWEMLSMENCQSLCLVLA